MLSRFSSIEHVRNLTYLCGNTVNPMGRGNVRISDLTFVFFERGRGVDRRPPTDPSRIRRGLACAHVRPMRSSWTLGLMPSSP